MRFWFGVLVACFLLAGGTGFMENDPAQAAQSGGCQLRRRAVDNVDAPIAGARIVIAELRITVFTGPDGFWQVTVPGPGTYHGTFSHPAFETTTRRYVLGSSCQLVSSTVVAAPPVVAPAPVAAAPARPGAPMVSSSGHRFTGSLTIEGRPAPAGTLVDALVGDTVCGQHRTTQAGRYSVEVAAVTSTSGCGRNGTGVQFAIVPGFGSGWRLSGTATFQSGSTTQRDLAFDPRRLQPRAENVPWTSSWWQDPRTIRVGICDEVSLTTENAIAGALQQWRDARQSQSLRVNLVADGEAACGDDVPGIAIVELELDDPNAVAVAIPVDRNMDPCRRDDPCFIFKALIGVNSASFRRLSDLDRPNVLAHEIGHALGLAHAERCTGGTIMWADTKCRFPLSTIGVDDIASLNNKVGFSLGEPLTKLTADAGPDSPYQPEGEDSVPADDVAVAREPDTALTTSNPGRAVFPTLLRAPEARVTLW